MKNFSKIISKDFWFALFAGFVVPTSFAYAITVKTVIDEITKIIGYTIPVLCGLALVYFLYGMAMYVSVSGEESKKEEGRMRMLWGIIALFVIVSVWGLVTLLQDTVFSSDKDSLKTPPPLPKFEVKK